MDQADVKELADQHVSDAAGPLIAQLAMRLDLDLYADDGLGMRLLVDLAARVFAAGVHFASVHTMANVLEEADRVGMKIDFSYGPPAVRPPETLGDDVEID